MFSMIYDNRCLPCLDLLLFLLSENNFEISIIYTGFTR